MSPIPTSRSDTNVAYAGSVGTTLEMPSTRDGAQPGDSAKAARSILAALDAEQSRAGSLSEQTPSTPSLERHFTSHIDQDTLAHLAELPARIAAAGVGADRKTR